MCAIVELNGGLFRHARAPGVGDRVLNYIAVVIKNNSSYPAESLHGVMKGDRVLCQFLTPDGALRLSFARSQTQSESRSSYPQTAAVRALATNTRGPS